MGVLDVLVVEGAKGGWCAAQGEEKQVAQTKCDWSALPPKIHSEAWCGTIQKAQPQLLKI